MLPPAAQCRLLARLYLPSAHDDAVSASVAPVGFCNRGGREVRYGSIGDLEYEVPQSRLYCLCINVALCSTALQCRPICRVIRRSPVTTKAHTYYIIFGRSPIGGSFPLSPWQRHCFSLAYTCRQLTMTLYTGVSQKCSRTDRYTTTKSIEGYQLHPSHTATSTTLTYGPITIAIRARFEFDSSAIRHPTRSYVLSSNNEHVNSFALL